MRQFAGSISFAACFLTACSILDAQPGRGPVTPSPQAQRGLERYFELTDASFFRGYFALSADGRSFGYSYCPDLQCRGNPRVTAIRSCQEGSATPCYLYAAGRDIVWDTDAPAS